MNGPAPPHDGESSNLPSRDAVEAQLERIFAADGFSNADRLKTFLSILVRKALDGAPSPSEYELAAAVFGRTDLDPSEDAIVRRTASRLRKELAAYYENGGKDDPVIIELPKGYVPQFRYRTAVNPQQKEPAPLDIPTPTPEAKPDMPRVPRSRRWRWAFAILLILGALSLWLSLTARNHPVAEISKSRPRRLLMRSTSEGQVPNRILPGTEFRNLLITPDGQKLYAIALADSSVTVLGVNDLKTRKIFKLPRSYRSAYMARDGRRLYISSSEGGIMVLDTEDDRILEEILAPGENAWDIAVTPDNRKLFLALGDDGLKRIDLTTGEKKLLSSVACPIQLDLDHAGTHLYVGYQCGGPGGRSGHDTTEIYDVESEASIWKIKDIPIVGGRPRFAPKDEMVLLDMRDACIASQYDHVGCPAVRVAGFYLWRPADRQISSTHSFSPEATMGSDGQFFPKSNRIGFRGDGFVIWDWARQLTSEVLPLQDSPISLAITPTEDRVFLGLGGKGGLLVLDAEDECTLPPSTGLTNFYPAEGTTDDAKGEGTLNSHGGLAFAPGFRGQAFRFDGQSAYLSTVGGASFCAFCTDSWSMSFFVKFDSASAFMEILNRESQINNVDLTVAKSKDNHIVISSFDPATKPVTSTNPVVAGHWYHIAVVGSHSKRSLFLDGVLQGTTAAPARINRRPGESVNDLIFLGATHGKSNFLHGLVDELSIYSRTLTPLEIKTMAQACAK